MDPFDRFDLRRRKVNIQAIIAFVLGVVIAYLLQVQLSFGGGGLFTALIVIAVGGFWYHLRRVV
jgi:hypothetical protein